MKKEIFAALLLVILAGISIWNLHYAESLTTELTQTLDASLTMAADEQWAQAVALAESASNRWRGADSYTHIFISHNKVDLTTDAFGDYLGELYRNDIGGARGAHQKLSAHIETIYEMERITLKSIF